MSRTRWLAFVGLLLSCFAFAGTTVAFTHQWKSGGTLYACSAYGTTDMYRCVSPLGRVVYVSGDTETGCGGDPKSYHWEGLRRHEGAMCFEDIGVDTDAEVAAYNAFMAQISGTPTRGEDILVYADEAEGLGSSELEDTLGEEGELWLDEDRGAPVVGTTAGPVNLIAVPCDDGVVGEDEDWSGKLR